MEDGEVGDHGQHVTETVGDQDLDLVTTPPRPMEDLHVMAPVSQLLHVQEGIAQEMDCGEVGHHGQLVEATVRIQGQEIATILLLQMGVKPVQVLVKYILPVLEDLVLEMECGVVGLHGHPVEVTVKDQNPEVATIPLPLMVENHALAIIRNLIHVQGDNAKLMVSGGIGLLGQRVKITA